MTQGDLADFIGPWVAFAFIAFALGMPVSYHLRVEMHIKFKEQGINLIKHPLDWALFPFEDFIRGWKQTEIAGRRLMIVWSVVLALQLIFPCLLVIWLVIQSFLDR